MPISLFQEVEKFKGRGATEPCVPVTACLNAAAAFVLSETVPRAPAAVPPLVLRHVVAAFLPSPVQHIADALTAARARDVLRRTNDVLENPDVAARVAVTTEDLSTARGRAVVASLLQAAVAHSDRFCDALQAAATFTYDDAPNASPLTSAAGAPRPVFGLETVQEAQLGPRTASETAAPTFDEAGTAAVDAFYAEWASEVSTFHGIDVSEGPDVSGAPFLGFTAVIDTHELNATLNPSLFGRPQAPEPHSSGAMQGESSFWDKRDAALLARVMGRTATCRATSVASTLSMWGATPQAIMNPSDEPVRLAVGALVADGNEMCAVLPLAAGSVDRLLFHNASSALAIRSSVALAVALRCPAIAFRGHYGVDEATLPPRDDGVDCNEEIVAGKTIAAAALFPLSSRDAEFSCDAVSLRHACTVPEIAATTAPPAALFPTAPRWATDPSLTDHSDSLLRRDDIELFRPAVLDLSRLRGLCAILPSAGFFPWPLVRELYLPVLSPPERQLLTLPQSMLCGAHRLRSIAVRCAAPSGAPELGTGFFALCRSLRLVDLRGARGIQSLGVGTFTQCVSLECVCCHGLSSLRSLGGRPFANCPQLRALDVRGCSPDTVLDLDWGISYGTVFQAFFVAASLRDRAASAVAAALRSKATYVGDPDVDDSAPHRCLVCGNPR